MRLTSGVLFTACVLALAAPSPAGTQEFQVVVHASVKGSWISRANLKALFTRQMDKWGDKSVAKPVDQSAKAPVRHAFTTAVLRASMGEIQRYWQDRVASQRLFPPPIMASDDEVLRFVAATAGAVGYVTADAKLPDGVRVLSVTD